MEHTIREVSLNPITSSLKCSLDYRAWSFMPLSVDDDDDDDVF